MDPYFLYMYGSGLEMESSRFSKPGDFFVYTAFIASVIVVRSPFRPSTYLPFSCGFLFSWMPVRKVLR